MSTSLHALQFFAESVQSVFDDVQLVPDVLHHAVDVVGVLQNVHALSVGVVAYREGTSKGLGKLPADTAHTLHPQLKLSHRLRTKIRDKQGHTGPGFTVRLTHHVGKTCSSPHFVLGFLKTVGHIVNVLKRGDHALLVAGHRGVKRKDVGTAGQSVLGGQTDTCTDVLDRVQTY